MFRKLSQQKSLFFVVLPVSTVFVFSIAGCSHLSYVNKSSLRKMGYTKTSRGLPTKNYGALAFKSHLPGVNQTNSRLLLLGKQKSFFFAETMIHQRKNSNSLINKSFISIGADRKKKGAVMQFRLVY